MCLISMPIVIVVYVLVGVVAAGAAPRKSAAGLPLTATAAAFMRGGVFTFFVIGGGVLANVTTLNPTFMFGTKSLLRMAADGWIPRWLAAVSPRYSTPHRILLLVYLVSALALLSFGEDALNGFAAMAAIGAMLILVPVMGAALRLRRHAPLEYETAYFKLRGIWYYLAPSVGIILAFLTIAMLTADLLSRPGGWVFAGAFLVLFASGAAYAGWQSRRWRVRHHSHSHPS